MIYREWALCGKWTRKCRFNHEGVWMNQRKSDASLMGLVSILDETACTLEEGLIPRSATLKLSALGSRYSVRTYNLSLSRNTENAMCHVTMFHVTVCLAVFCVLWTLKLVVFRRLQIASARFCSVVFRYFEFLSKRRTRTVTFFCEYT